MVIFELGTCIGRSCTAYFRSEDLYSPLLHEVAEVIEQQCYDQLWRVLGSPFVLIRSRVSGALIESTNNLARKRNV
jgi:hypothetical protein